MGRFGGGGLERKKGGDLHALSSLPITPSGAKKRLTKTQDLSTFGVDVTFLGVDDSMNHLPDQIDRTQ